MRKTKAVLTGLALASSLAACGEGAENAKGGIDMEVVNADGKSDLGRGAKVIDAVGPEAEISGEFDPKVRVYAYVVEANAGAQLSIALDATAGSDAADRASDGSLDTVMAVYGPYTDRQNTGPKLAESEDGEDSLAAPPINLKIEEDGRYLVAFMSYQDTGKGNFELNLGCDGTDFQCRRANLEDKVCEPGQLFVQGGQVNENAVWKKCEVTLLEPTTVAEGKTLTIDPGVTVKGNFLQGDTRGSYGTVSLTVLGTLQAVGTTENPIQFTSMTDQGWAGLRLKGPSNSIENAFIDSARIAIELDANASGEITDVVLDGSVGDSGRTQPEAGIQALTDSQMMFRRALVHDFQNGVVSRSATLLEIEDSVIRNNQRGVLVIGAGGRITNCPRPPAPPTVWRDPVIKHTDIHHNGQGIVLQGNDALLQIEFSNIVDNEGIALNVEGSMLNEESYLRNNNIVRNGGPDATAQVSSVHVQGQLDLSMNYWEDLSDPALSANWNIRCNGTIDFSGFHPEPVAEAGPRTEKLRDEVKQEKLDVQQDVVQGGN